MSPLFFLPSALSSSLSPPSLPLSLIAVDVERGVCGLLNMGNTCYMNAGLQCIRNLPEIATYYLSTRLYDAMLILRYSIRIGLVESACLSLKEIGAYSTVYSDCIAILQLSCRAHIYCIMYRC